MINPLTYIITIPEPCHEDWNAMLHDTKGKFCKACNKSVFDFTNKTDKEIRDILLIHQDQQVCGHFKKTQINRPLSIHLNLSELPKNMNTTKMFMIALFLVFGTFLFSCMDHKNKKIEGIEVVNFKVENTIPENTIVPQTETRPMNTPIKSSITQTVQSYHESHVSGGISMREVDIVENIPLIAGKRDTTETFMTGKMTVFIPPQKDSSEMSSIDSSKTIDPKEISCRTMIHLQTGFVIYPNPGNGEFTIEYVVFKRGDVSVQIYNLDGALMKTVVNIPNQYEGKYHIPVNATELAKGIYIVNLISNGKLSTERLIIEK